MNLDGRQVLVTGAGGFICAHLAAKLLAEGANVRGFVRFESCSKSMDSFYRSFELP
jgi:dTDP-glucose 4,6-dehydratase